MYVTPASFDSFGRELTDDGAERLSRNWTTVLLSGLLLILAGLLIFSIDWSVRGLATFIGALFIVEGFWAMLTTGTDNRAYNVVTGLPSMAAGIAIIVWPSPSLAVLGIFLGAWLIVIGTVTISGAFAGRRVLDDWWLLLVLGLVEVPLGVLALAAPDATVAALVIVGGIYAVVIGATRIVLAFELKDLPNKVHKEYAGYSANGAPDRSRSESYAPTAGAASS